MIYLCSIQAFGSQKEKDKLISNEFSNQNPCDLVVKQLFWLPIDIQHFRVNLHQLSESFFLDIVVQTILQHRLIVVVTAGAPPFIPFHLFEQSAQDFLRLPLLLNKRDNEPNDIRNDVPVLNLLHFPLPLASATFRTVIFVYRSIFWFSVFGRWPRTKLLIVSYCCLGEGGLQGIEGALRSLGIYFGDICLCKFQIVKQLSRGRQAVKGSQYVVGWVLKVVLSNIFLTMSFEGQLSCFNIIYNTYITSHHLSGDLQIRHSKKVKKFPLRYNYPCFNFVCLSSNLPCYFYRLLI